jgi:two-component system copper resistance phosphate regulon response regulator CusR
MKLLIVEDDPRAAQALERSLRQHCFLVETAFDGLQGLSMAKQETFDCLILDVMLPGMDGFTLVAELRTAGIETPVVFLTARDALPDRIRGLEVGGGDYLVKPFAFSELLLRINNLLQRGGETLTKDLIIGDLSIHRAQRKVYRGGKRLDLSNQEYALLDLLARNRGNVVTRTRIAEELWELAFDGDSNLVDAAVRRLRKKVEDPFEGKLIHTRRGVGYILECPL